MGWGIYQCKTGNLAVKGTLCGEMDLNNGCGVIPTTAGGCGLQRQVAGGGDHISGCASKREARGDKTTVHPSSQGKVSVGGRWQGESRGSHVRSLQSIRCKYIRLLTEYKSFVY